MAQVTQSLEIDMSAVTDALDELQLIHRRLVAYHGPEARQLGRDIEMMADSHDFGETTFHNLGEGRMMAAAPEKVVDALRRARDLRVLRA